MVVVGADVHKRSHTFVAVDQTGRKLGQLTVEAITAGHLKALGWARREFGDELEWAIEDCRHLSSRLERDLLGAGQTVVRVPPKMTGQARAIARTRGKSDPIDALAVARAALAEPNLPRACHDDQARELKLLVDRRDTLITQRTATINSLRWRVHELDPEYPIKPSGLDRAKHQQALAAWLAAQTGIVAELATDELEDVIALTGRINVLEKRIAALVAQRAPELVALPGCGALTAAKLVGEIGALDRFDNEAQLARHAGIAPIPVWSGRTEGRVRMTRSGNRQINCAIHRIAVTQTRLKDSLGRAYYDKKKSEGMSNREALRCLKRHLIRLVFTTLKNARRSAPQPCLPAAA
ncbi:IS110 family transposase [Raineyella fluvialis]|uniref:IS110 family transposase n=1 Tax=Raineyella fluvialis TaxID=2662261 RepID=A0A5Q2F8R4_9ACTN|nr:IS110 family transposase [Raineyella fluvialis]QGF23350.1 IS110 family transposase [Raineyella fluvialis]